MNIRNHTTVYILTDEGNLKNVKNSTGYTTVQVFTGGRLQEIG
ncbi:hypothetical protein [Acetivibrio clariflavus]|nr:hypothetical protein [Acetivibrio clariflavus]